jgi:hypothetical protein
MTSVIYCLGYGRGPLPDIALPDGPAAVMGCMPDGRLLTAGGDVLPGVFGAGIAFAEDELSSGAPYPEASLKAFSARANAIAEALCATAS